MTSIVLSWAMCSAGKTPSLWWSSILWTICQHKIHQSWSTMANWSAFWMLYTRVIAEKFPIIMTYMAPMSPRWCTCSLSKEIWAHWLSSTTLTSYQLLRPLHVTIIITMALTILTILISWRNALYGTTIKLCKKTGTPQSLSNSFSPLKTTL